jgi:Bacterial protein of unknown function (DUF839)
MRRTKSLTLIALATAGATAAAALPAFALTTNGPSTTTAPYVLPVADGVDIKSLLTAGDAGKADNGYEMVGIPDGLGAYRKGKNTVVLMNHELRPDVGIVRAHGQKGAFVSKLTLDPSGRVLWGEDFIKSTKHYRYGEAAYGSSPQAPLGAAAGTHTAAFARFCSGSLTDPGQLLASRSGKDDDNGKEKRVGYDGQIYFANEESGDEGRAFGVTLDGTAYQLPRLGLFSWENTIAAHNKTKTTVVMGDEDGTKDKSELWVYAGEKQRTGSPVDRAGLTNGRNHAIKIAEVANDTAFRATYGKGKPAPFTLQDIEWNQNGAAQNAEAISEGALGLTRIEDGAFNPDNKNEYFFLTTEGGDTTAATTGSRDGGGLWKLTFANVEKPQLGGTLELLLDGTEEWGTGESRANKPDNMMIDSSGNLLIQEDPGGNDHLARILSYRIEDGARGVVARFDPALFGPSTPTGTLPADRAVLTTDEESSGIIQLPDGTFLFDAQVHTAKGLPAGPGEDTVEEYVERGQLMRMTVKDFSKVYMVGTPPS